MQAHAPGVAVNAIQQQAQAQLLQAQHQALQVQAQKQQQAKADATAAKAPTKPRSRSGAKKSAAQRKAEAEAKQAAAEEQAKKLQKLEAKKKSSGRRKPATKGGRDSKPASEGSPSLPDTTMLVPPPPLLESAQLPAIQQQAVLENHRQQLAEPAETETDRAYKALSSSVIAAARSAPGVLQAVAQDVRALVPTSGSLVKRGRGFPTARPWAAGARRNAAAGDDAGGEEQAPAVTSGAPPEDGSGTEGSSPLARSAAGIEEAMAALQKEVAALKSGPAGEVVVVGVDTSVPGAGALPWVAARVEIAPARSAAAHDGAGTRNVHPGMPTLRLMVSGSYPKNPPQAAFVRTSVDADGSMCELAQASFWGRMATRVQGGGEGLPGKGDGGGTAATTVGAIAAAYADVASTFDPDAVFTPPLANPATPNAATPPEAPAPVH